MDISIYTLTLGRELYLERLIETILLDFNYYINSCKKLKIEHHIGFQGIKLSNKLQSILDRYQEIAKSQIDFNLQLHLWDKNYGAGEGNNKIIPFLKGDLIVKLDDDAAIRSQKFFSHILEINRINPYVVFSPYPVGLINNPGGILSNDRYVLYGQNTNTYYTFRIVNHVGGFGRISPAKYVKGFKWPNDLNNNTSGSADVNFSYYCRDNNIQTCYLENAIIIEHQESTLGQIERTLNL